MAEQHTARDVKAIVMEYLRAALDVPVTSKRRDDGTAAYVLVIDTGGAGRSRKVILNSQLTLDSYGASSGKSADLARRVDALMYALPASPVPVARVRGFTPSYSPDPVSGQDRHTATYQLKTKII